MSQLKLALRSLTKTPFVTAVAVLSLGLGIGANAAIFSLFDQILLRPLPVEAPEQLVNLAAPGPKPGTTWCNQAGDCEEVFSYQMFRDLEVINNLDKCITIEKFVDDRYKKCGGNYSKRDYCRESRREIREWLGARES